MDGADAFLSGKLVDENGVRPLTAHYNVITEGSRLHRFLATIPCGAILSMECDPLSCGHDLINITQY
jgi:hypothetical protein